MKNIEKVKNLRNLYEKNLGLTAFLLGLIISALLFVPIIIQNNGVFMYYGDFDAQEIPFYHMIHDAIRAGNINWSSTTDLGSATVASYSFYLIGSPFFLSTLLFPNEAVPFLIGPLFMLKVAFCTLTAYIYLKRYVKNGSLAVAGGLLYAFSGFSIYNIFFFHFHEPMVFFPLLLYCVDEFMYKDRRGILAAAVFMCCAVNYYFFAGMAVFTAIYWFMLVFTNNYKLSVKKLLLFAFEIILGAAATAFLILPTILFISGNPRLSSFPDGFNSLVYDSPQRYWYIILSFFFPPELAAQPNFTPDVNCNWASVSGWLPLVGMTGVIGYLQLKKRDWIKKLILLLAVFALIPVLNSSFQLFNSSIYYARWYYMFVLILVLATVKALENSETDWNRALCWSGGITAAIALFIGLMPESIFDDNDVYEYTKIGLADNLPRYWIYVATAVVSLTAFALIIRFFKRQPKKFYLALTAGICLITVISSTYIVETGNRLDGSNNNFIRKNLIGAADSVDFKDIKSARSDFMGAIDNAGMYLNIPTIRAFHSVVSPSIMKFYKSLGITRDVNSEPDYELYGLRGLLSVKYLFCDKSEKFVKSSGKTKMPGWSFFKKIKGYKVYKNDYYIPMGFMYDSFLTRFEFSQIQEDCRNEALLKAMVLGADDILKYSDITGYTKKDIDILRKDYKAKLKDRKFESKSDDYLYGRYNYFSDCNKLRKNSCRYFNYTNDGFVAEIDNKGSDNLLFFSVPYDDGWSAYIDGKKTEIVNANIGFMAVRVKGYKKSKIEFKYNPPGFLTGIIITAACGIIFVMYIFVLVFFKKRRRGKYELRRKNT